MKRKFTTPSGQKNALVHDRNVDTDPNRRFYNKRTDGRTHGRMALSKNHQEI